MLALSLSDKFCCFGFFVFVFVFNFFVFVFNRFLFSRFSFVLVFIIFFVLVLVFVNEFVIFSFFIIFVFVFVNENHTEVSTNCCGCLQLVTVVGHSARVVRLSFVGELGWELHVPNSSAEKVYSAVWQSGSKHGLVNAGYRAIDSLSIEKGSPLIITVLFHQPGPDQSSSQCHLFIFINIHHVE